MKKAGYVGPLWLFTVRPLWQKQWQFIHVAEFDTNVVVVVAFELKVSSIILVISQYRGSYTYDHFIRNLLNEPLASLIDLK